MAGEVELTEELMKEVDSTTIDPGSRAQRVLEYLKLNDSLTTWDVLCFCIEYVASIALAHPILITAARVLTKWLYINHYISGGFKEEIKLNELPQG